MGSNLGRRSRHLLTGLVLMGACLTVAGGAALVPSAAYAAGNSYGGGGEEGHEHEHGGEHCRVSDHRGDRGQVDARVADREKNRHKRDDRSCRPGGDASRGHALAVPDKILSVCTVRQPESPSSCTARTSGFDITADLPRNTFHQRVQPVFTGDTSTTSQPPGKVRVAFGLNFYADGGLLGGSFPGVTVKLTNPSISSGDRLYVLNGSTWQPYPAVVGPSSLTFVTTTDANFRLVSTAGTPLP